MFLDKTSFPFVKVLEDNVEVIRDEYLALEQELFSKWFFYKDAIGWDVFGLMFAEHSFDENAQLCPKTVEILRSLDIKITTAGFSKMKAHGRIPPHIGFTPTVLTYHLGLVVPNGCYLKSGNQVVSYETGKSIIFDDMPIHEAWNESDEDRVTLMLNFVKAGVVYDSGIEPRTLGFLKKKFERDWRKKHASIPANTR